MIHANLTLKEKLRYASIGEYTLTADDVADACTEDDLEEAQGEGYRQGYSESERKHEYAMQEIEDKIHDLISDAEKCPLSREEILEELKNII